MSSYESSSDPCAAFLDIMYVFVRASWVDRNHGPHTHTHHECPVRGPYRTQGLKNDSSCAVAASLESSTDGVITHDTE